MPRLLFVLFLMLLPPIVMPAEAQILRDAQNRQVGRSKKDNEQESSASSKAKRGIRTWVVDERSGLTDSVAADTLMYGFQNTVYTEGPKGFYNTLGNTGSPRQAKIFTLRPEMDYFIFGQPYDFFLKPMGQWHFTNTFSPITNLTYHECGSSDNGEDHLTAKYAVNINKDAGVGFNIDYIYGRGYFDAQSTADFGFNLYGSYLKDHYKAHWRVFTNYLKTHENGGIQDDAYVTDPQRFPTSYTTREIPVNLNKVWNKLRFSGLQLTHRYSMGYRKVIKEANKDSVSQTSSLDSAKKEAKAVPEGALLARDLDKNLPTDSLQAKTVLEKKPDSTVFVPVTSIVHTLKAGVNSKKFLANQSLTNYYLDNFLPGDSVNEDIRNFQVSNYLALELSEGLNKYLSAGIRLFGQQDFNSYQLPNISAKDKFNETRLTLGAEIFREKSQLLNYSLLASTSSDGKNWGEYELRANGRFTVPMLGDSVALALRASSINRMPTFFYRHFQSKYLWWNDDNLSKQLTNRIGATLESKRLELSLSADAYTISNYTYFATSTAPVSTPKGEVTALSTSVAQSKKNVNLLVLQLDKNFRFGIFNWENSLIYQTTSDKRVLPLPQLTAYSNLFIRFKIARVLNTEFGADCRYFTKYYAPTYSVALGQFANQADEDLVKVGNHPVLNVYVNFLLKHTRLYVMVSHLNHSNDGGTTFGAPHYPINPQIIRFGLSWNFFN